ncbi:MAG: hypothetical protein ACTSXP_03830 [Promethearchaeota archaeon]
MEREFNSTFQQFIELKKTWILMDSNLLPTLASHVSRNDEKMPFQSFIGVGVADLFGMAAAQILCGHSIVMLLDSFIADETIKFARIFQTAYEFPLLIVLISNIFNDHIEMKNIKRLKRLFRAINIPFFTIHQKRDIPFIKDVDELAIRLGTPAIIHLNNSIWRG